MSHFRQISKELLISLTLWAYLFVPHAPPPPQAREKGVAGCFTFPFRQYTSQKILKDILD